MPTGVQFDLEASTRMAQAKAIVRGSGDAKHEELYEVLQRKLDELTILYRDDEEMTEDAYISLVERADALYYEFVRATGGKEALVHDRTRPRDESPLRYKLTSGESGGDA
jgi:hypothetical protein